MNLIKCVLKQVLTANRRPRAVIARTASWRAVATSEPTSNGSLAKPRPISGRSQTAASRWWQSARAHTACLARSSTWLNALCAGGGSEIQLGLTDVSRNETATVSAVAQTLRRGVLEHLMIALAVTFVMLATQNRICSRPARSARTSILIAKSAVDKKLIVP